MQRGDVDGQAVLAVKHAAAVLAVVLKQSGEVDALHVVDNVGFVHVAFAAECARVEGFAPLHFTPNILEEDTAVTTCNKVWIILKITHLKCGPM